MRPSSDSGATGPVWLRMPSRTSCVRLRPRPVALEHVDDAQRVLVVAEAALEALAQRAVERRLARVPEGRVAEVVAQADRLGQVLVEAQRAGDGARDPDGLERVREPRAVVVALGRHEDLRLVLEPPERLAVGDAVAVALEGAAEPAGDLGDEAAARLRRASPRAAREPAASSASRRARKVSATGPVVRMRLARFYLNLPSRPCDFDGRFQDYWGLLPPTPRGLESAR